VIIEYTSGRTGSECHRHLFGCFGASVRNQEGFEIWSACPLLPQCQPGEGKLKQIEQRSRSDSPVLNGWYFSQNSPWWSSGKVISKSQVQIHLKTLRNSYGNIAK